MLQTIRHAAHYRPARLSARVHNHAHAQAHLHPKPPSLTAGGVILGPQALQTKLCGIPSRTAFVRFGSPAGCSTIRSFHSTPRREAPPALLLAVFGALKASTALETARLISRVALTFAPVILFRNHKSKKVLRFVDNLNDPTLDEKRNTIEKRIRNRKWLFHALVLTPIILFWAAIIASLERTPLTGRWRVILLAPEEEDEIAQSLAGGGWHRAISDILSEDGPVAVVPAHDWRHAWVAQTLRRLEQAIPAIQTERELGLLWLQRTPDEIPLPPPAQHPLRPRPNGKEWLRSLCDTMAGCKPHPSQHIIQGPPYSLMLVEKPDVSNAFSYGFGPDGAGGVVVYSGFLDEILARGADARPPARASWWAALLGQGGTAPAHPTPTPQQSADLAILLAHELSHLLLAHHLETLSSATVVVPGILSMVTDVMRVLLFPVTMIFGPFVNDAVANLGKVGSGDLTKISENCTSVKQEIEADVVSARILAYAGYDPREAVRFWQNRGLCFANGAESTANNRHFHKGSDHPVDAVRVEKLKEELARWESEKRKALEELERTSKEHS